MKGTTALTAVLTLTLPALAMAHVSVQPRESKPGVEERYGCQRKVPWPRRPFLWRTRPISRALHEVAAQCVTG